MLVLLLLELWLAIVAIVVVVAVAVGLDRIALAAEETGLRTFTPDLISIKLVHTTDQVHYFVHFIKP
jgi:hypothetical protein